MAQPLHSISVNYHYCQKAIPGFDWQRHPHKANIESTELTISPTLTISLLGGRQIQLQFAQVPQAGLKSARNQPLPDNYNQGPFLDKLAFSIESQQNITVVGEMSDAYLNQEYAVTRSQSKTRGTTTSASFQANPQVNPQVMYSQTTGESQQTTENTFRSHPILETGEYGTARRGQSTQMEACYGKKGLIKSYSVENIETIHKSNFTKRFLFGFVAPFVVSWYYLPVVSHVTLPKCMLLFKDKIYKVPSGATTCMQTNWIINYRIPNNINKIDFKWITTARTVFVSTDTGVPHVGEGYSILNCIKTSHQITYHFSIEIIDDNKQLQLTSSKPETYTATFQGYGEKSSEITHTKKKTLGAQNVTIWEEEKKKTTKRKKPASTTTPSSKTHATKRVRIM